MAGGKTCKRRASRRMFECMDNVGDAGKNQVVGGCKRHGSLEIRARDQCTSHRRHGATKSRAALASRERGPEFRVEPAVSD
jgi:hypothetical protein